MSIGSLRVINRRAKQLEFKDFSSLNIPEKVGDHAVELHCETTNEIRKYTVKIKHDGKIHVRSRNIVSLFLTAITFGRYQSKSALQINKVLDTQKMRIETKKQQAEQALQDSIKREQCLKDSQRREKESAAAYRHSGVKLMGSSNDRIRKRALERLVSEGANSDKIPGIKPLPGSPNAILEAE
ncbi:hypothetical protein D5R81_09000 [Parashewanella spongiae]|uniref:Uncharacterized protein n=1 Tax=Parashewanella spongiae TaxID=342950 RepID=A0A3A6U3K1_9GAMM|nr:hypothetical protein [Parashewanella spongiae]MCL1077977.1 hypothetical protein [Parashewanella spongiae]RJY16414.1 hypothetical protein D5R81_09000 [Parashewanella spongiae]